MSTNVIRFGTKSVDGWGEELWCIDGKVHALHTSDEIEPSFDRTDVLGDCDGSCKEPRTDLRELISELARTTARGCECHSASMQVHASVEALLASDAQLVGRLIANDYCKRNSRGKTVCINGLHISVSEDLGRSLDEDAPLLHEVSSRPCDGSCHVPLTLSKKDRRLLRKALRSGPVPQPGW